MKGPQVVNGGVVGESNGSGVNNVKQWKVIVRTKT
jgi:hypothetical protein